MSEISEKTKISLFTVLVTLPTILWAFWWFIGWTVISDKALAMSLDNRAEMIEMKREFSKEIEYLKNAAIRAEVRAKTYNPKNWEE